MLCPSAGHGHAAASVTEGKAERQGVFQPEEEKARGDLTTVYKYLLEGGRGNEDGARPISVEPSKRRKDSEHELK